MTKHHSGRRSRRFFGLTAAGLTFAGLLNMSVLAATSPRMVPPFGKSGMDQAPYQTAPQQTVHSAADYPDLTPKVVVARMIALAGSVSDLKDLTMEGVKKGMRFPFPPEPIYGRPSWVTWQLHQPGCRDKYIVEYYFGKKPKLAYAAVPYDDSSRGVSKELPTTNTVYNSLIDNGFAKISERKSPNHAITDMKFSKGNTVIDFPPSEIEVAVVDIYSSRQED